MKIDPCKTKKSKKILEVVENFLEIKNFYCTKSGCTRIKILPLNSRLSRLFFRFYPQIQGFQGYFLHIDQIQGFSWFSRLSGHRVMAQGGILLPICPNGHNRNG